ncbi:MAG: hypothetical protein Q9195_000448 [Heterodermia aff. obscurata]
MANLLGRLPIEIRNQIYEDLLLYKHGFIMLNYAGNAIDAEGDKVGLHTAILRTCKQVYAEGSNVLYGHNRFRYTPPLLVSHKYGWTASYQLQIPKNQASHRDARTRWSYPHDICTFTRKLGDVLRFLNFLGCSLKTLYIKFVFHDGRSNKYDGYWEIRRDHNTSSRMQHYREIFEIGFSGIQVGTSITITLDCFDEELGAVFEDFANAAAFKERWTLKTVFRKTTLLLDERRNELWDDFSPPECEISGFCYSWDSVRYTWTWTLTPAIKANSKESPKSPERETIMSNKHFER